eukprot:128422-Prymnesium_polylepis.1
MGHRPSCVPVVLRYTIYTIYDEPFTGTPARHRMDHKNMEIRQAQAWYPRAARLHPAIPSPSRSEL